MGFSILSALLKYINMNSETNSIAALATVQKTLRSELR